MSHTFNPQLDLAYEFVENTNKHIFLTGKAGTGKTTFLHEIRKKSNKRLVVVAPTGVAAINAGGMTMHSFFQLPFGSFLPSNKNTLRSQRKFSKKKIDLIRSLDLVIIDEISMVRADLLDAVDDVLRRYKDYNKPFGGVQLLMIGDLHQLPPVVKQDEWDKLREYYDTAYFFGSLALQETEVVNIQLTHIYRQSDSVFIDLLNKVRNNQIDKGVLEALNSRYIPNFQSSKETPYITLASHNATARRINTKQLNGLKTQLHTFKAKVKGDFPNHAYPTDETLELKVGAQVVFIKNDLSPDKAYYNGKIGEVKRIEDEIIYVKCPDEVETIEVSAVDWDNVKFSLKEKTKEVEEKVVGTFTHYPLKLAWAITIHKSQGLTFDRAIIDAKAAFAHGQVYVALSRCRTFEGIVLLSKIGFSSVRTDGVVQQYSNKAAQHPPTNIQLALAKQLYQQELLHELFDFKDMQRAFEAVHRVFLEFENSFTGNPASLFRTFSLKTDETVFNIANKFLPILQQYFALVPLSEENEELQKRLKKASSYFTKHLKKELLQDFAKIPIVTDNSSVEKRATEAVRRAEQEIFVKNACFETLKNGFSVSAYIKAKADATIDFAKYQRQKSKKKASVTAPKGIDNSKLYLELNAWREEVATEKDIKPFEIFSTKTLIELAKYLPTTAKELLRIKGIGKVKVKQYGDELITVIEDYCKKNNLKSNLLPLPVKIKKQDTKRVTLDYYNEGKTIGEIAKERGLTPNTIEGHLGHFVGLGWVDIFDLMERWKVEEIESYFRTKRTTVSSKAKEHFGEKYSYGEIKMVLKHLQRNDPSLS